MQAPKAACGLTLDCLYKKLEALQREAQLNAHGKFIAARLIQKIYRGYRVRKSLELCRQKAVLIQRLYRAYMARSQFYIMLEMRVQEQFQDNYNRCAIIIQKWFRGYYSRKYIHDFRKLRATQRDAAKELILCVAHKLHHLLRTRQIPGIYSLRNSHCLSKVEELLASLRFKEYNEEVRHRRAVYKQTISSVEKNRKGQNVKLNIPFGRRCQEVYRSYSIQKLHKTLETADNRQKKVHRKPMPVARVTPADDGLYAKVVKSMERFNIVKFDDLSVCPQVLQRPEKIEQFCCEMTEIYLNPSYSG